MNNDDNPTPAMTSRQLAGFLIYTLTALKCIEQGEDTDRDTANRILAVTQGMLQEMEKSGDEMHMHAVAVGDATMDVLDHIVSGSRPVIFRKTSK